MQILEQDTYMTAFIRPEQGANVVLLHTQHGRILIDTTSSPLDIQALVDAAEVKLNEVSLVINTHFHSDHTWGNQIFSCPILAHRLCQERMRTNLKNEWSSEALLAELADLVRSDPSKAAGFRTVILGLQIKAPDQIFEDRYESELGGLHFEVIHMGGHTPDTAIIWLPEQRALYASDLIFQGRYPYVFDADIPAWIGALNQLLEYKAEVIIPGHGISCGDAEIVILSEYLERTWELTKQHIHSGHDINETLADPAFPVFPGEKYERLHHANIRYMFTKQTE